MANLSNLAFRILDNYILTRLNFKDCLRNLKIVLRMEKTEYVLDKIVPYSLLDGSSVEEYFFWEKMRENDMQARNYIMASISSEFQLLV